VTKHDYQIVALALRAALGVPDSGTRIGGRRKEQILTFSDELGRHFENFNSLKFVDVCTRRRFS